MISAVTATVVVLVDWGHCARMRLTYFTCTHLLLAGNDTVPISLWRGGGMRRSGSCCFGM